MSKNTSKLLFIFLLCLNSFCKAQISETPTFLWMVLSKENKTPSFIYGTVHHLGPKLILDNKQLMSFILQSKLIVQEADTSELLHPTDTHFDFSSDTALDELLGYADYQFVKYEFSQATGRDLDRYKNKMPQVILAMIDDAKEDKEIYKSKTPMMENTFYALSIVKKIPIKGLETRRENFDLMYKGMPLKDQAKLLMYYLRDMKFSSSKEDMKPCFEKQDLNCLCKIDDMSHYTRPGDSTVVIKRNLFWIKKIENYIKQGNIFIAVGAAHLCGDSGIIALLKKRGYAIVPILTK